MNNDRKNPEVAIFVGHDLIGLMTTNKLVAEMKKKGCDPVIINTGIKRNRTLFNPAPPGPSFHMADIVDQVILPFLDALPLDQIPDGKYLTYKHLAATHGLEYLEIDNVNDPAFLDDIRNKPNMIGGISVRFLQVFGPQAIDVFEEKGFLWNLHSGVLPEYQGLHIPLRVAENNDNWYGWTLHKVAEGIDTGDVIEIIKQPFDRLSSVFRTYSNMVPYGVVMITTALEKIRKNISFPYTPQSLENARYYPYPTSNEMQRYERELGVTFVGELDAHINTIVETFLDPSSKLGRSFKKELCKAALDHLAANENADSGLRNEFANTNTKPSARLAPTASPLPAATISSPLYVPKQQLLAT